MKTTNFSAFALDAKSLKQIKGGDENTSVANQSQLITDPLRKKDKK